ncbi:hypothetical protein FRC01_005305 [Tulasnella sp. 417]|nr:hypothetical protein FRC01_005305 [Tulasnella sp. 417]
MYCCLGEALNPWPIQFRQFEHWLPEVFNRSFEVIEEQRHEDYMLPLRLNVLEAFTRAANFFDKVDGSAPFINDVDIPPLLDIIWTCTLFPGPLAQGNITDGDLLEHSLPVFSILSKNAPSWRVSHFAASLDRVVTEHGSTRIAQRIKELCESIPKDGERLQMNAIVHLSGYVASNFSIKIGMLEAGVPRALLHAFWVWIRIENGIKAEEFDIVVKIFRMSYGFLNSISTAAEYEDLMRRTLKELLDEDFIMFIGKYLIVAQYQERFMEEATSSRIQPFHRVFPSCEPF